MKTNAPKQITWIICVILGGLAILSHFVPIPVVSENAFWFLTAGFVGLTLGTLLKDL